MNMQELLELRGRLIQAKANKQIFAAASKYAAALEAVGGPVDFDGRKHSVKHLLALVEKAIRVLNAPKAPEKPKAKPAVAELPEKPKSPPKAAPKVETKPDAKKLSGVLPEMPAEPPAKKEDPEDLIG